MARISASFAYGSMVFPVFCVSLFAQGKMPTA
jgi:hypothetical protein